MSTEAATLQNPFSFLELACTCANVRRAARAATQLYDTVLSPSGIRISQFIILRALYQLGAVAQCRLSEAMGIAAETLSRRLELMRRIGWVELQSGRDKRQKIYFLTEAGVRKFEDAFPYWKRAQKRLETVIGSAKMDELKSSLELLTAASREAVWARISNAA